MMKKLRMTVNIGMTLVLIGLMAYSLIGTLTHEILGIAMFVLFTAHHILNRKWFGALSKGKYRSFRIFQTVLVFLLIGSVLASAVSGIILSEHVFVFLPFSKGTALARSVHMVCAYARCNTEESEEFYMKKQTAGREHLGELAPKFAELNDDVLFGEVWSRESQLSLRDRSMITIAALFSAGLYPQLKSHLSLGKEHGVTKAEAIEIVTQLAFYCGWPKAWSTFPMIQEVFGDDERTDLPAGVPSNLRFPVGKPNEAFAQHFIGKSYLAPLTMEQIPTFNVTFEPGCRNNWHIHHADKGGGQLLICVYGRGWYQEWGKEPRELHPGDVVNIPANIKHWHGAAADSWFQHIAQEIPGEKTRTEWCEPVDDDQYRKLVYEAVI